jgi:hypothetical protein
VEGELVEHYLVCAWRLKRLRRTEMGVYQERQSNLQQRLLEYGARNGLAGTEGMEKLGACAEIVLQELLNEEAGILERLSRYEQRMFNSMLRCARELRTLQKEDIELPIEEEPDAQNEATAPAGADVQNEATEAADQAKSSLNEHLEPPLHEMVTGEAREMALKLEEMDRRSSNIRLMNAILRD